MADETVDIGSYVAAKLSLTALVEALLFASERPVTLEELAKITRAGTAEVKAALAALTQREGSGLILQRHGGAYLLVTHPAAAPYIQALLGVQRRERLSRAALETLAAVAYCQPATRADIERVRGVNSDHTLAVLLQRGFIAEVGRRAGPGRPVEYGTTFELLKQFGIAALEELPQWEQVRSQLRAHLSGQE